MEPAREALERELSALRGGALADWATRPLLHNGANAVTASIERVTAGSWSAVLKVLSAGDGDAPPHWRASAEPTHWNHWRREALVYAQGLPERYAGSGIDAPRLLGLFERSDREIALWLEDVRGTPGPAWTIARHERAARALGVAQGRVAARGRLPDDGWLSRGFLRDYSGSKPARWELLDDDDAWARPLVREHFPPSLRGELLRLREERERWLARVEALPRTLCHLDLWPPNLIARDDDRTALVDWAFAGHGALGEDIGNLVPDCVFDHFLPAADLAQLDRRLFRAYLGGLRQGGWDGDERLVRLAVCASAVKYDWLAPLMLEQAGEETQQQQQLGYGGEPAAAAARRYAERGATLAFLMGWLREARELARRLGR